MLPSIRLGRHVGHPATYPGTVNWVDLVIIASVAIGLVRGGSRGALRQIASLAGLAVGFVVATREAPRLSTQITHAAWRPLIALGIVLFGAFIGSRLGVIVGSLIARSLQTLRLGSLDRVGGAALGGVGALVGCWLLAGLLGSVTWGSLATGIQNSRILAAVDKAMPPLPAMEAKVQALFRSAGFPAAFASVVAPAFSSPVISPARLAPSVTALSGPANVVKVLASGACASTSEGTAFFISPHDAVTNAHVVAGHTRITVDGALAQVALFDPLHDIAILRVPSLNEPALRFLPHGLPRGTPVRVVGFPLNGTRTGTPGRIEGELTGQARDIYNQQLFTRTVLAVETVVEPGNSGSPVLVGPFVTGVIESKSLSQAWTAYAIPGAVVQRDAALAPTSGTVSTQNCLP